MRARTTYGALDGPFFDHFFASILDSILDSFWARLGFLLAPFWEPKSGQVGPKMRLERIFVRKYKFSRGPTFSNALLLLLTPRRAQDRRNTGPGRIQER